MDDGEVGTLLKNLAILEIRAMARRRKPMGWWPGDDFVAAVAWLADLCHNMPDAGTGRSFAYAWRVADDRGRTWILDSVAREGIVWDPPPG
ncbi:hypothetical protein Aab01nite_62190 [Paractinoplanes abujensis]|uniref:Uncharacterized protein n=1 Tax=Paractinoplanes abujensis TaxID=882441 RepID=A0A7W7CT44_9ACTN|nr:hypothetical protein [Actinoplanes abujensis]MBB4692870.1 hypothetical protein [Actinoplanes abujensis]GID22629.1 hypothetical protein Aab01nite_62190 [Actinoplanes abujensis]